MEQVYFFRLLTVYAVNSVFTKGVADSFRLFYTFVCALLFLQHFQEKQDLGLPAFPFEQNRPTSSGSTVDHPQLFTFYFFLEKLKFKLILK